MKEIGDVRREGVNRIRRGREKYDHIDRACL